MHVNDIATTYMKMKWAELNSGLRVKPQSRWTEDLVVTLELAELQCHLELCELLTLELSNHAPIPDRSNAAGAVLGRSQFKSRTQISNLLFWDKDLNHVVKSRIRIFFEISNLLKTNFKLSRKRQCHTQFWYRFMTTTKTHILASSLLISSHFCSSCSKRNHMLNKYILVTLIRHCVWKFRNQVKLARLESFSNRIAKFLNRIANRIEYLRRKWNSANGSNRDLNPNRDSGLPITAPALTPTERTSCMKLVCVATELVLTDDSSASAVLGLRGVGVTGSEFCDSAPAAGDWDEGIVMLSATSLAARSTSLASHSTSDDHLHRDICIVNEQRKGFHATFVFFLD